MPEWVHASVGFAYGGRTSALDLGRWIVYRWLGRLMARGQSRIWTMHSAEILKSRMTDRIHLLTHNQAAWNLQAAQGCAWSASVSAETIATARAGDWSAARLTPGPPCPPDGWIRCVAGAFCAWQPEEGSRPPSWQRRALM